MRNNRLPPRDNPLIHSERYGRTYDELVKRLYWGPREPDPYEVAEIDLRLAKKEVERAKQPSQWARQRVLQPLPPRKRGRPATVNPEDVRVLESQLVRYCNGPDEARRKALKHLSKPYRACVVFELFELARWVARSDTEARDWVAEFLHLSDTRIKALVKSAKLNKLRS